MTAATGTTWRLELRQYSILRSGDLLAQAAAQAGMGAYSLRLFLDYVSGYVHGLPPAAGAQRLLQFVHSRFLPLLKRLCWLLLLEGC